MVRNAGEKLVGFTIAAIAAIALALFALSGCAGIDHRTTGSPVMDIEWAIAPLMSPEQEAGIPTDGVKKGRYLAELMTNNGGFWFVNSWSAGSLLPSITIVTEYFCDPGTWPKQAQCRKTHSFAASDSGWLKQLGTATIIGGSIAGGARLRRPNQTNVNQTGGGASSDAYSRSTSTSFGQKVGKAWGGK